MYGRPRSKSYVYTHFKKILKENNLPDIRWHDLRATFATILLKNNYSPKAVSKMMGHAKEIITVDVYGDTKQIIEDCLEELEPFIEEILPKKDTLNCINDYQYIFILDEYYNEIENEIKIAVIENTVNDFSFEDEYINIIEEYFLDLKIFTRI